MRTVSLAKEVNETYKGIIPALETQGTLSDQQKSMILEALEYCFKKGYTRGRESK